MNENVVVFIPRAGSNSIPKSIDLEKGFLRGEYKPEYLAATIWENTGRMGCSVFWNKIDIFLNSSEEIAEFLVWVSLSVEKTSWDVFKEMNLSSEQIQILFGKESEFAEDLGYVLKKLLKKHSSNESLFEKRKPVDLYF
ncbi:hypothetical protein KKH36_03285 [Patescibacteria group bacterium]|nr:hypothetical protein [Patescibacteria group bacterium]